MQGSAALIAGITEVSGRVLVIDRIAPDRIAARADLEAGRFDVVIDDRPEVACATALRLRPDLIMIGVGSDMDLGTGVCAMIRGNPAISGVPIIVSGCALDDSARLSILRAGADDIFDRRVPAALLQARVRSLLRDRTPPPEVAGGGRGQAVLGFADDAVPFAGGGLCLILSDRDGDELPGALAMLARHLDCTIRRVPFDTDVGPAPGRRPADLVILDGAEADRIPGALFRRIADLRAGIDTRHVAVLALLPSGAPDLAVMTLDLGANDIVTVDVSAEELALRAELLLRRKQRNDQMRDRVRDGLIAAFTDPLTGLANRRHALPRLDELADLARCKDSPLAVMMLDIDHFKRVNDLHGHAVGDRVLIEVARRLRREMREGDILARIGGEEFLVAMPDTGSGEATLAAERLRRAVEGQPFPTNPDAASPGRDDLPLRITLSIGVAVLPGAAGADTTGQALYVRADGALYGAKAAGRNTVTLHPTAA